MIDDFKALVESYKLTRDQIEEELEKAELTNRLGAASDEALLHAYGNTFLRMLEQYLKNEKLDIQEATGQAHDKRLYYLCLKEAGFSREDALSIVGGVGGCGE